MTASGNSAPSGRAPVDVGDPACFVLGPFVLDAASGVLLLGGQPTALGGRGVAVLRTLVAAAPAFVAKDAILEAAWPGLVVEESNLSVQVSAVRKALAAVPGGEGWLQTLSRRGYRYVGPVAGPATAVAPTPAARQDDFQSPTNLPEPVTSFIGRQAELAQVQSLLQSARLLTLLGPGGIGKTRLALHAAQRMARGHAGGAWLVELAALSDPTLVPQSVAAVLGVQQQPGQPLEQTLALHLRHRDILLVLDNAEHLVDACAALAADLLGRCPALRLLVTSRERLAIDGEACMPVPALDLPDEAASPQAVRQSGAAQLFIERARLQAPHFEVSDAEAGDLSQLCRRLDGLPLALELAASRIRTMTVAELAQRLDQRFRLLTGGTRTAARRHQTLRALIDWSHDLLTQAEQALLARVSVFVGGWTLEAAESVCSGEGIERWEVLDLLRSLVDKSLVSAGIRQGQHRYGLLESVRDYAAERLAPPQRSACSERHLGYFAALCEGPGPTYGNERDRAWIERIEPEHQNLRAALAWAAAEGASTAGTGLRLAASAWAFWHNHGHLAEGQRLIEALLQATPDDPGELRARALIGSGALAYRAGHRAFAHDRLERALEICRTLDDGAGIAAAQCTLGALALGSGDFAVAQPRLEEALAIGRRRGAVIEQAKALNNLANIRLYRQELSAAQALYQESIDLHRRQAQVSPGIATPLMNLGLLLCYEGDYASARPLMDEALGHSRASGMHIAIPIALTNLGYVALHLGDTQAARAYCEESIALGSRQGNQIHIADATLTLGRAAQREGDLPQARRLMSRSLRLHSEQVSVRGVCDCVDLLGHVLAEQGDPRLAAQFWGWADARRQEKGTPRPPNEIAAHEAYRARTQQAVGGEPAFQALLQAGQGLSLDAVLALA